MDIAPSPTYPHTAVSVILIVGIFVLKSHPILCHPTDCGTPGFSVLHCLLEFAQTRVRRVGDGIQPSRPLPPPSAFNLSQHQGHICTLSTLTCQRQTLVPMGRNSDTVLGRACCDLWAPGGSGGRSLNLWVFKG